jgi:hypothetical protein
MKIQILLALACPLQLLSQASVYNPPRDPAVFVSENSYLMYFVRGTDTLGQPITTRTRETHVFVGDTPYGVSVSLRSLDGSPFARADVYTIDPFGRVLRENGKPVADVPNARVDFLPRLPRATRPLEVGDTWNDSVYTEFNESFGKTFYRVNRRYSVARVVDSLGTKVAVIIGEGTIRLRQGGWEDSTRGVAWWQQVSGSVKDTVWFDLGAGWLLSDVARMDLRGTGGGGLPNAGVSMPSGLRSTVRRMRERR